MVTWGAGCVWYMLHLLEISVKRPFKCSFYPNNVSKFGAVIVWTTSYRLGSGLHSMCSTPQVVTQSCCSIPNPISFGKHVQFEPNSTVSATHSLQVI